jgi:hypothetical protein
MLGRTVIVARGLLGVPHRRCAPAGAGDPRQAGADGISAGSGTPAARAVKPPDQDADALLVEVCAEQPAVIGVDAVAVTSRASSRTDTVPSPPSQGCAACGRDRARCSCSQLVADLHGRPASDDVLHTALRPWRRGAIGGRGQCWLR